MKANYIFRKSAYAFLCLYLFFIIIMDLTPPVTKDALIHHLAVPKLYIRHGGIYEIPDMEFSYFPMNIDLLYIIPLYFGNDIIPKYIHFFFALLTAWLVFNYIRREMGLEYGLLGSIFFLTIPIIVKLSMSVYVDLGLVFFTFASLIYFLKWIESDFRYRFLIISAIFCGLSLGTEYNALIHLLIITLSIPFIYVRKKEGDNKNAIKNAVIFVFISIIIFSPWLIKNFIWTGNPLYPLFDGVINGKIGSTEISLFRYRHIVYNENLGEILLVPLRIFFQGKDGVPKYFDGALNPGLILFIAPAYFLSAKSKTIKEIDRNIFITYSFLYILFVFFTTVMRVRYIAPVIPALTIVSIAGIKNLIEFSNNIRAKNLKSIYIFSVILLIGFVFLLNIIYMIEQFKKFKPIEYITGKISKDKYIEEFWPEYPSIIYINKNLPPDSRVLMIFNGKRGYYCDKEYMIHGAGLLSRLISQAKSSKDIKEELNKRGITHLLINTVPFEKWSKLLFKDKQLINIHHFLTKETKLIYYKNNYAIFRIN